MPPSKQASAPYICFLYLLLFLPFSVSHWVAHDFLNTKRNIPAAIPTSVAPKLRIGSSKIAVPFGDRHASYGINFTGIGTYLGPEIGKRQSEWMDAISAGTKLLYLLQRGKRRESYFVHPSQMIGPIRPEDAHNGLGYGWVLSRGEDDTPFDYDDVFRDLNIPPGAVNEEWQADQNVRFRNCRRTDLAPAFAKSYAHYNVPGKTITSLMNYSPAYMLKEGYKDRGEALPSDWATMLPDVQRWSDLTWILWASLAGPKTGELKYIFRHDIITHVTKAVIALAAGTDDEGEIPMWPGRTFKLGDPRFVALLGTPHGRGIVYLLTQHPIGLPGKSIETITAFRASFIGQHLLFTLTD